MIKPLHTTKRLWSRLTYSLLLALLATIQVAHAQVANSNNYTFSTGTGATLTQDMNGNPINLSTSPNLQVPLLSTTLATMDIGFDFYFMGTRYFQLTPLTRGVIGLGPLVPSAATVNLNQVAASNAPLLAPFWNNNSFAPATGPNLRSTVVGTAPNRCFVFEWRLISTNNGYFTGADMVFQTRLYETSGIVEYVYGNMALTAGNISTTITQAAIGFTMNTNLNNRLASVNDLSSYTNTYNANQVNNAVVSQQRSGTIPGFSGGRYFRYTPSLPSAPTTLTFSGVTGNSMTLNWTDNSTDEVGFAVYRSDDGGATFNYITLVPQNITTFTQTLLTSGVNYQYRIFAVSEGGTSAALIGNQTTSTATTITSTTTGGNWSDPNTWVGGVVPTSLSNVTIADGATVVIDNLNATCNNLTIGQGASGSLVYSSSNQGALFVNGDVTISNGASFTSGTSNIQTHALTIGGFNNSGATGNLVVNGTLNLSSATSPTSGSGVILTFGGAGNAAISGTGSTCNFFSIIVNKGIFPNPLQNPMLDVTRVITISTPTVSNSRLIVTSGTFRISSASTLTPYNGTQTLVGTGGRLWLNHASCSVSQMNAGTLIGAGSPTINGELRIDNGTFTYGSGNNTMTFGTTLVTFNGVSTTFGSRLVMNGGTLNMFGAISFTSATPVQFIMTGGAINVDVQSANLLSSATTAFNIGANTSVNWSGGTVTIVDPYATTGSTAIAAFATGGQKIITGGTLQIGDGISGTASGPLNNITGFLINLATPVWNLVINNRTDLSGTRICRIASGTNLVLNNVTVNSNGYLMLSTGGLNGTLALYENLINNGTIAGVEPGATTSLGILQFIDSVGTQTMSGSGTFYNIAQLTLAAVSNTISSTNNVSFNQTNQLVVNAVLLGSGTLTHNGKLTIGRPGATPTLQIGTGSPIASPGMFATVPNFDNTSFATGYSYVNSNTAYVLGALNEIPAATNTVFNLTVNTQRGLTINRNLTVVGTLTMTLGNISIGNNNLTLGSGLSNVGTLTYVSGNIICGTSGTFTRWYNTTSAPTSALTTSLFPLGGLSEVRHTWLYFSSATALSGAGTVSIRHANVSGLTPMTAYTENLVTIDSRTNANWVISTGNGLTLGTGTISMQLRGDGALIGLGSATNITVTDASGVAFAGTFNAGTGTVTNGIIQSPLATRTAIPSFAALTAGPIYLGAPSVSSASTMSAIRSGQWNNPNTWSTGIVPTLTDNVIIPLGVTINVDSGAACVANMIIQQPTSVLNVSGNSLTITRNYYLNGLGNNFETFSKLNISGGTLTVIGDALQGGFITTANTITSITGGTFTIGSGTDCSKYWNLPSGAILNFISGTINIYGSVLFAGTVNQLGGAMSIYPLGPIGGPYTAAASATGNSITISNSTSSYTGGTITIVDPPFPAASTSAYSLNISTSGNFIFTGTHTFIFGDGVSTAVGTNNAPFRMESYQSSRVPVQNVIVNGGPTANRHLENGFTTGAWGNYIKGTFQINSGSEFRHQIANEFYLGGTLINNGTFTDLSTSTAYLINLGLNPNLALPLGNVTISGTGTFRNALTAPTGSLSGFIVNLGNPAYRAIVNVNGLVLTTGLTLASGQLDIGSNNIILGIPSTNAAATLTHTAGSQILTSTGGSVTRVFPITGLPTAAAASSMGQFPLGRFNTLNNSVERRDVFVSFSSATGLTTGGTITVTPSYANGYSSVTPFTDGTLTNVDTRTNSFWNITNNNLVLGAGSTILLRALGENAGIATNPGNTANTTLMLATGVATGTYAAGTNFLANVIAPDFNRNGLVVADISNINYYGGTSSGVNTGGNFVAIANGEWNSSSTWSAGAVPTATDNVQIPAPYTVVVGGSSSNFANNLTINAGGTLIANNNALNVTGQIINSGTLTIGGANLTVNSANTAAVGVQNNSGAVLTLNGGSLTLGPVGGGKTTLTNLGTLTFNAGTATVNGNMLSSGTFNMVSGSLTIDGNDNTSTGSVANGTALVSLSGTQSVTGGTITIVDPPFAGAALAFSNTGTATWTNNTLRFGDGVSTHTSAVAYAVTTPASQQTAGFGVASASGNIGNIVVNGNGTNRWVTINGTTLLATSLTINSGSELRSTANTGTASTLNLSGFLLNNGTLTSAINNTLIFSGSSQQNVSGSGVFRVDTLGAILSNINNLTVSNTSVTGVNLNIGNVTVGGNASASGTLALTGILNIGANTLTLGTSATLVGSLSSATGAIVHSSGGGFRRWYSATTAPTTIAVASQFPIGVLSNGTLLRRDLYVASSTATLTSGGTITVSHTPVAGTTPITTFNDGAVANIDTRSNSYWSVANAGITSAGTLTINAIANGIISPSVLTNTTMTTNSGIMSGTLGTTIGTQASPQLVRTAITFAGLSSNPDIYVGAPSANFVGSVFSTAGGNWTNPAVWSTGAVPSATDSVVINPNHYINLDGNATVRSLSIAGFGGLTVSANTLNVNNVLTGATSSLLTVNGGTLNVSASIAGLGNGFSSSGNVNITSGSLNVSSTGLNNRTLTIAAGTFNVAGGTVSVDGNINFAAGTWQQSGGLIRVDGNNSTSAGSVPSGTNLVQLTGTAFNVTGGTLLIVDPPFGAAGLALNYNNGVTSANWTNHTLQLGDGISTDVGITQFTVNAIAQRAGFGLSTTTATGTARLTLSKLIVNGGSTSRIATVSGLASANSLDLSDSLIINAGSELRTLASTSSTTTLAGAGINVGGHIVNNGRIVIGSNSTLGFRLNATTATITAQNVTGSGQFLNDTAAICHPCLSNVNINNTSAAGVNMSSLSGAVTIDQPLGTVGSTLTFGGTGNYLNLGSNSITLGSTGKALTLTGTFTGTSNLILTTGSITRWFNAATAISGNVGVFPIGLSSSPINFNRAVVITSTANPTTAGSITVSHVPSVGVTPLTSYADGTVNIDRRTNTSWNISTNGITGTSPYLNMTIQASGLNSSNITNVSDLRLSAIAGSASGLPGTNAGSVFDPVISRTGLNETTLASSWYLGGNTTNPLDFLPITNNTVSGTQTVCSGSSPSALAGSDPQNGTGFYTYLWQASTTSASTGFSNATGVNNDKNYQPSAVTQNTWFRRVVISGNFTDTSAAVQISTNAPVASNTLTGAQTICNGTSAAGLTGSTPTGGNGTTYSYLWLSSTTNATTGFSAATGTNNAQNYTPSGSLTATMWFRRVVSSGACNADTSTAVQVTVTPGVTNNSITSALQAVCSTPSTLTGSAPNGGNNTYTYLWQESTTNATSGFSAAAGSNNTQNYTPSAISQNTWYRRVVTSSNCSADTSAAQMVLKLSAPSITSQPVNSTVGNGANTSFSVSATGDSLTYQWQVNTGSGFANITNGGVYSSATTATLNLTAVTSGMNSYQYRCIVNGFCSPNATSNAATLTVNTAPAITSHPSNANVCSGGAASFTVAATGTSLTYQWQVDQGSGYNNISNGGIYSNATTTTLNISAVTTVMSGYQYRCVVSSGLSSNSNGATLNVSVPVTANTASGAQIICAGNTPVALTGSTPTGGNGTTYAFQWLSSTTNATSGFTTASGSSTLQNYSPGVLTANTWYKRIVTSGACGADTSAAIAISVNQPIASNTLTGNQTICSGNSPSQFIGSTPTGGSGSYTYGWLSSTTSATAGFTAIGSTNSISYTAGALTANTWFKRVVIAGPCSNDTSAAILVTVNPVIAGNTVSGVQSICSGATPATLTGTTPTGGTGSFTYSWLVSSTSATSGFSIATGTNNTANYSPASLTATRWYRRLVISGSCADTSVAVQITVNPTIASNTVTGTQTICSGSTPSPITGSTPTGGNSTYTYLWQRSTTSAIGGYSAAPGTNNTVNYTSGPLTTTSYLRRVVTSGGCSDTSAAVTVTVNPTISNNSSGATQAICSGSSVSLTGGSTTGGNNTYTYQWQQSTTSAIGGFTNASGASTGANYSSAALTANTWFRRVASSGGCVDSSIAVAINVIAPITSNTIGGAQTICSGSSISGLTGSAPSGGVQLVKTDRFVQEFDGGALSPTWSFTTTGTYASLSSTINSYSRAGTAGAIFVNNYSNTTGNAQLVSPIFNATSLGDSVRFDVAARAYPSNPDDTVRILVSNGGPFTPLITWTIKQTVDTLTGGITTGAANTAAFTAPAATDWITKAVSLPIGTTQVRFDFISAYGNNVYVDRVRVDSGLYQFQWLSSTTSASAGFSAIAGATAQDYVPTSSPTQTTWFKRVVNGICRDTSTAVAITVGTPGTWTGAVNTAWGNTGNWSCPQLPTSTTNVIIPTGATNMPVINDSRQANNITIQPSASLTLNATTSNLSIFGVLTNNGTISHTNGEINFTGSTAQIIPTGIYARIRVSNSAGVSLAGNTTLNDSLILTSGVLTLGNNNLVLGNTAAPSSGSATSYVRTNGTGAFTINNIGSTGKSGNIVIPVGNSSYNPVVLANTGTTDNFSTRVIDSVTNTFTGNTPTGAALTSNVVNRTWLINEAVVGGSNATVTLQWNTTNELSGFTRANSYVAVNNGATWNASAAGAASGTNPYTRTRTGITTFAPMGVASNGALPVTLVYFDAKPVGNDAVLVWETSSELNNNYFEIERSIDGVSFESTGITIKGKGTTNTRQSYRTTDKNARAFATQVYYRLKQVDFDGTASVSEVASVTFDQVKEVTSNVLPNPFTDYVALQIQLTDNSPIAIHITDVNGKTIDRLELDGVNGMNEVKLNSLKDVEQGVYFVTVITADQVQTHKVIKK
jgi:hypothetical protein